MQGLVRLQLSELTETKIGGFCLAAPRSASIRFCLLDPVHAYQSIQQNEGDGLGAMLWGKLARSICCLQSATLQPATLQPTQLVTPLAVQPGKPCSLLAACHLAACDLATCTTCTACNLQPYSLQTRLQPTGPKDTAWQPTTSKIRR